MSEAEIATASDWSEFTEAQLQYLTRALLDSARDLARDVPPPRGLPFFGLDDPSGALAPFERLAARGIFRKYESVLLLGSGLGCSARWCHAHYGCYVKGIEPVPAAASAARKLSERAGLAPGAQFLAALPSALSLRPRYFTHVWAVEARPELTLPLSLREAFRVLRLGGLVALQRTAASRAWAEETGEALAAVGFTDVVTERISRPPLTESLRRARERLLQALRAGDVLGAETAAALERVYQAWPQAGAEMTQVFARRP